MSAVVHGVAPSEDSSDRSSMDRSVAEYSATQARNSTFPTCHFNFYFGPCEFVDVQKSPRVDDVAAISTGAFSHFDLLEDLRPLVTDEA